ncbi:MAG TPA: PA2778 family cysteine peptidase [Methylomirabilota bacterium]|jgi:ABC-type bacteriocin/lantibiotic exporter with double-glycine peptidase domain|nr:PA2778 family cysteine peptidase [Methylomirabilota bacterium]
MRERLELVCALLVAMLLLAAGCASRTTLDTVRASVSGGHAHLISTVPFIPQEEFQCGPATLAMVLQYYGAAVGQDEIARELYLPSIRGTLNLDLEFYARRRGFQARSFAGTLERVKDELRRDRPLIVFQDLGVTGYPVPHFAVLLGYDDRTRAVVLHSGTTPYRIVSYAEFERSWARRRAWTLLITPAS